MTIEDPIDAGPGPILQAEPTALDFVLESIKNIASAHTKEMAGFVTSAQEWQALHHDAWASYATYLYDLQETGNA